MEEFFGDLERLAADAYPWRWLILGLLLVAGAGVAAFGYRRGWHEWAWGRRVPLAIVGIPLMALGGFLAYDLGSPLFTNKTVEEEFPFAFPAIVPPGMDRDEVEQIMAGIAQMDQDTVDEVMPPVFQDAEAAAASAAMPAIQTPVPAATPSSGQAASATPVPTESAQAATVKLKTGSFRDQDSFHKGSGEATIFRGPDGSLLLRLENLRVTNGPDLHVILSPHPDPGDQGELKGPGYIDLGKLKGNRGNQNYEIPDEVDVAATGSVVIYCKPFHVIFSVASLEDAG